MAAPFQDFWEIYRKKGWFGTLPLPEKKKESPPTEWTGKAAGYPHKEHLKAWGRQKKYKNGNICIRLAGVTPEHEAIGIDVDHYESGGKQKLGGDQLEELENRLGKLPDAPISSARSDGISGIRWFRVPRGLSFRGKAAKDIDVISKGYRYGVVWPSIHPLGWLYLWYLAGNPPDGNGLGIEGIPEIEDLPLLPDEWIDFLSAGKTPFTIDDLDLNSSPDELVDWAHDTFFNHDEMCFRMREKLEKQKKDIEADPSSHDKITKAHWNITKLASEGHYGWYTAIQEIERFWFEDVGNREKRTIGEANGELFRSRTNALRKIKALVDDAQDKGAVCPPPDDPECVNCSEGLKNTDGYDDTHRGNGQHFRDLKQIDGHPTIFYISDWKKWIVWNDETKRWKIDEEDGALIRREWMDVEQRQKDFVEKLKEDYEVERKDCINKSLPMTPSNPATPDKFLMARAKYQKWAKHVKQSGDSYHTTASIREAASLGLTIKSTDLNWNKNLIACCNGVLEIDQKNKRVNFRDQKIDDLITLNTNVYWKDPDPAAVQMWNQFLDTFLPDAAVQRMAKIAVGHTLLEGNRERVFIICLGQTSTGKSTFVRLCGKALGEYAAPVNKTFFQGQHKFKPSLKLNARKTMVYTTEFDGSTVISTAIVKEYTGGDRIETERKGVDEVDSNELNFVPMLATNQMPVLSEPDLALKRRLYILPFNEIITKDDEDKTFGLVLERTGLEAVLHWIVDGLVLYMQNGEKLIHNQFTDELVNDAVIEMGDWASEFIESCLEMHEHHDNFNIDEGVWTKDRPEWTVDNSVLYQHLKAWMMDAGYQPRDIPTANTVTRRLRALGLRKPKKVLWINGRDGRYWLGVKFRPGAQIFTMPTYQQTRTN